MTKHNKESGFTLVELAIVMIIIGLLIGGILKGQELISNAQTTATIAQIKGIDGAISTFNDKYSELPGDMATPGVRLSNCAAACAVAGDGLGTIGPAASVVLAPAIGNEGVVAFLHMGAADLISGVENGTAAPLLVDAVTEAEFGGSMWIGYHTNGNITPGMTTVRRGHYLAIKDQLTAVADGAVDGISAVNAGRIDRKLDDGNADTGDVRSTGGTCDTNAGAYQEGNNAAFCDTIVRIQG